jgi:hypothetical protein
VRLITDEQRRARLGTRHALACRAGGVEEAAESVVCLHATEAPTVYLSVYARAEVSRDEIDRALYADRTLVKQLAMRRTLFAFPRELLPAVWGSAAARVATQQRTRMAKEAETHGLARRGDAWLTRQFNAVRRTLAEDGPATTAELRERVPALATRVELNPGKKYGGSFPIGPRVLGALAAEGTIVRGANSGDWRLARPQWTLTEEWLGALPSPLPEPEGYAELVRRWLHRFGPGTEDDIVWWLGATKGAVRRALGELDAVEVQLEHGATGHLLPDDVDDVPDPGPWAALLPVLDPTTMGWKHRDFYLDPEDRPYLFDTNGNAGTTAWWNGRIVGCWVQDESGEVLVVPRGELPAEARAALDAEARRLTDWLAGTRVSTVYSSLQMKSAQLP